MLRLCFYIILLSVIGLVSCSETKPTPDILLNIRQEIYIELEQLHVISHRSADSILAMNNEEDQIKAFLDRLRLSNPFILQTEYIDCKGKRIFVRSNNNLDIANNNYTSSKDIVMAKQRKSTCLGQVFHSTFGYYAISMIEPILENDKVKGYLNIIFRPESIFEKIVPNKIVGVPVDIWILQDDGTILYDDDEEEIGNNIFKSYHYEPFIDFLNFAKSVIKEESGNAVYNASKHGDQEHFKQAFWNSLEYKNQTWSVIMEKSHDKDMHIKRDLLSLGMTDLDYALVQLAHNKIFLSFLAEGEHDFILDMFKEFYDLYPGIYSVQWLDSNLVNQYGFPNRNSLNNYKFTDTNLVFVKSLLNRQRASFERKLIEGNIGLFHSVPLYYEKKYLGMIYTIRIKP